MKRWDSGDRGGPAEVDVAKRPRGVDYEIRGLRCKKNSSIIESAKFEHLTQSVALHHVFHGNLKHLKFMVREKVAWKGGDLVIHRPYAGSIFSPPSHSQGHEDEMDGINFGSKAHKLMYQTAQE